MLKTQINEGLNRLTKDLITHTQSNNLFNSNSQSDNVDYSNDVDDSLVPSCQKNDMFDTSFKNEDLQSNPKCLSSSN